MYQSSKMKLWQHPQYYMGANWPDYYVAIGRNRDSDILTNSNFETFDKRLKALGEPDHWDNEDRHYYVVSEGHWACGWVEWIAIHKDWEAGVKLADDMLTAIENYPVLDEDDFGERTSEASYESISEALRYYLRNYADLSMLEIGRVEQQIAANADEDYIDSWPTDSEIERALSECNVTLVEL